MNNSFSESGKAGSKKRHSECDEDSARKKTRKEALRLAINKIELEGFKCFKHKEVIGPFDRNFSCISGPNGSGKSSIIEALCFVLGFGAAELRGKSLSKLISDDQARSSTTSTAEVTLHCNLYSVEDEQQHITRRIVGNSSEYYIADGARQPTKASRNAVRELLKEYAIDINFADRFLIMQYRTIAIAAKGPLEILQFLEGLIGTAEVKEHIVRESEALLALRKDMQSLVQEQAELDRQSAQLAPQVASWEKYQSASQLLQSQWRLHLAKQLEYTTYRRSVIAGQFQALKKETEAAEQAHYAATKQYEAEVELLRECEEASRGSFVGDSMWQELQVRASRLDARIRRQKERVETACQRLRDASETVKRSEEERRSVASRLEELQHKCLTIEASVTATSHRSSGALQTKIVALEQELAQIDGPDGLERLQNKVTSMQEAQRKDKERLAVAHARASEVEEALAESIASLATHDALTNKLRRALEESDQERKVLIENTIPKLREVRATLEVQQHAILEQRKKREQVASVSRYEHAVAQIAHELPRGVIHGFLRDLASVEPRYFTAVNAILRDVLAKVLVVENRDTALKVVEYFRERKIGTITCEILSEIQPTDMVSLGENPPRGTAVNAFEAVRCHNAKYRPVLAKFLRQWWIATTRAEAMHLSHSLEGASHPIRRNAVTLDGERFFSWGEASGGRCDMRPRDAIFAIPSTNSNQPVRAPQTHEGVENVDTLDKEIVSLQQQLDDVISRLAEAESRISALDQQRRSQSTELARRLAMQEQSRKELRALEGELSAARAECSQNIPTAVNRGLLSELAALEARRQTIVDTLRCMGVDKPSSVTSSELRKLRAELATLQGMLCKAEATHKVARCACEAAEKDRYEAESELQKLQQARAEVEAPLREAEEAQRRAEVHQAEKQEEVARRKKRVKHLNEAQHKAAIAWEECARKCRTLEAEIVQVEEAAGTLQHRLEVTLQEERNTIDAEELASWKALLKRDEAGAARDLREERAALHVEEQRVQELEQQVSLEALEEFVKLQRAQETNRTAQQSLAAKIDASSKQKERLENERYAAFHTAIKQINHHLVQIYKELTKSGDCYLQYAQSKAVFEEGVLFHVKPDRTFWKPFHNLSGGQQALAALALSLAFQSSYPSSIFVFDEIDASLDVLKISRVVEFVKKQANRGRTQYIVVSLRPEFYQKVEYCLGVYQYQGTSRVVTLRCNEPKLEE